MDRNDTSYVVADLCKADQVSTKKAESIVQHRDANGPFESIDSVGKIKGIGTATVNGLRKIFAVISQSESLTMELDGD